MVHSNIVFRSLLMLALLCTGIVLANGTSNQIQLVRAQAISTTINEYPVLRGTYPWGTAMSKKGRVWVALPGCDPSPTCSSSTAPGKFNVFDPATSTWVAGHHFPAGYAQALFLAFDQAGNLWFPMPMDNSIGMYNPANNTYRQWSVPTPGAGPWDLAIDSKGIIWFTEHYTNKIGRFDPVAHSFSEISTPSANSQPYGITIDHAGNVWFTENNSSVALIAEYTVQKQLLEYKIRNSIDGSLTPHLITVDPNGNIWWTEGFVGEIGELKITQAQPGTNNGVTEYSYPRVGGCGGSHTSGIAVDGNGLVWFDDSLQCTFGSFPDSGTGTFSMHSTPTSGSHPHDGLMVDSQNRIWFDEEFANKLARVIHT